MHKPALLPKQYVLRVKGPLGDRTCVGPGTEYFEVSSSGRVCKSEVPKGQ